MVDLERALGALLGDGAAMTLDEVEALLRESATQAQQAIETNFGNAGWYGRDAPAYDPPSTPFDAPPGLWTWSDISCVVKVGF
jgi:hypothetical protein